MIDAYRKIKPEKLYRWIQSLEETNGLESYALRTIKEISKEDDTDWYTIGQNANQAFYDKYVNYKGFGIRVANMFECFIKCSDWNTYKSIIKGYGSETVEIGSISLYENNEIVGEIGAKSDIIWSVYYDYFIQEDGPERTLTDDESLLSIQIWNVKDDETELENRISSYLLDVSFQTGMKFEIVYPDTLWEKKGINGEYHVEVGTQYDSIAASYVNYGMNCNDSRVAFLHLYEGMEYFFYKAEASFFRGRINQIDLDNDAELRNTINDLANNRKEINLLRLVIEDAVDVQKLRRFISSDKSLVVTLKKDYGYGQAKLTDDLTDEKYIEHLTIRIYRLRCAIAHAKGDFVGYIAIPNISNEDIAAELPVIRYIAYRVLNYWSKA